MLDRIHSNEGRELLVRGEEQIGLVIRNLHGHLLRTWLDDGEVASIYAERGRERERGRGGPGANAFVSRAGISG